MFYKKCALKNFTKFTGKHLWQSLSEFCEIFKNTFLQNTSDDCFSYFKKNKEIGRVLLGKSKIRKQRKQDFITSVKNRFIFYYQNFMFQKMTDEWNLLCCCQTKDCRHLRRHYRMPQLILHAIDSWHGILSSFSCICYPCQVLLFAMKMFGMYPSSFELCKYKETDVCSLNL